MKIEKEKQSFSIILPVFNRPNGIKYAMRSIINQSYDNWELIVVDDASTDETPKVIEEMRLLKPDKIKVITHAVNSERAVTINDGYRASTKDWICIIASDDEYMRQYFRRLNWSINRHEKTELKKFITRPGENKEYTGYKCYNFGSIIYFDDQNILRVPYDIPEPTNWLPQRLQPGRLGAGQYIFHRSLLEDPDVSYLPEAGDPYEFADMAGADIDGHRFNSRDCFLGNPWGEDYYLIRKIIDKYKSKMLNYYLYVQNNRRSEDVDDPD